MNEEHFKHFMDGGAVATAVATFAGWLPSISALLTIVWMAIRIYETKTVGRLLGRKEPR